MKTLAEAFEFVEKQGWDICVLEENYNGFEDETTVYGFSKNLGDDTVNFLALFAKPENSSNKHFVPTAENLANWINAAWIDRYDWERTEIRKLENMVRKFIKN